MEGLGVNLGYLIVQIGAFLVLYLLLRGFAFGPISRMLEERQARIAKGLEDARQAAIARDNADAEVKKILDDARAEAAQMRTEASVQAEEQAQGILSKANEDAKKIVVDAREDAVEERNRILGELRTQVAAISIAAANKVVGESLDEKRQRAIVDSFISNPPEDLAKLTGERADVTSALPLTDKEKDALKKRIGIDDITFKVNPGLLGGLIIRAGDQVVDDSVSSRMSNLRESLVS